MSAAGAGEGAGAAPGADKSKELQMEILMEKLRGKSSQYKSLAETSKAVRMNMLDKRWAVDGAERLVLQRCLDSLQHCIKVNSLQSLKERLECLSRQLGLKFMVGASGDDLFISSDMFYLEVLLEPSGDVKDVKIHHEGKMEQQSCEELVLSISRGDFADFTAQLEGLTAVYQLNAEKKVKCKAFSALQSLEADLCTLGQLQAFIKEPWAQVHKSPIGFLQKRRGGHAMRLTYFVSPYELLDKEKGLQPLTPELLAAGRRSAQSGLASLVAPAFTPLGHSATVLLEGSVSNKLQVSPVVSVGARPMGKTGPVYAPLGLQNSSMLPACFTLKLSAPMPLCSALAQLIHATTEVECGGEWGSARPLLGLVVQHAYGKLTQGRGDQLNLSRGLFVNLPDQSQCYFVCESRGLTGCVVSSVPFTHPSHVPPLLACLRQQALFNTLIASCVRPPHRLATDLESMLMFEVSALSWQHISISLEHPLDESMATVELELADPAAPRASVYTLSPPPPRDNVDEYITRVLNMSHSIPVTLRALIKVWEREAAAKQLNGGYSALDGSNFSLGLDALDPGGADSIKQEPGAGGGHAAHALYPHSVSHPHQGTYLSDAQQSLSLLSHGTEGAGGGGGGGEAGDEKRSKKRKSDGEPWPGGKRGKQVICEVQLDSSSESDSEGSEQEDTINSASSADELASEVTARSGDSPGSQGELGEAAGGLEGDSAVALRNSFHRSEHKKQKHKKESDGRNKLSASALLLDLTDGKSAFMPSSVSITPIGGSVSAANAVLCLDRRPGIEIIPIQSTPPASLPSSITITPISSSQAKSMEERHRSEKKSSKSSEERSREKKKKKKREDPMGPPDKLPPKQDPLTKPVSVSIKPTDGSPLSVRPASPSSLLRKFSPSPTHGRSVSITKSPSPSSIKSLGKPSGSSSHHSSPRHSPVQNSPKHLSGYSSPKNHSTSSPKHSSSGSGKPSMSALKSAASGSPSGKSTSGYDLSKKMSSKDGYTSSSSSRDKEKKHSGMSFSNSGSSSPKIKPTSVKLKQLEITPILADTPVSEALVSPPNVEVKSSTPSQVRNRKGSLSAVIDKLKSAQHCGSEGEISVTKTSSSSSKNTASNKFTDSKSGSSTSIKISDSKNQEYMVKPSSDGMKITINKTRTKESSSSKTSSSFSSSSSSSSSSSVKQSSSSPQLTAPSQGSPKTHTGLKPGVLSGPASKKTQVMQSTKSSVPTGGSVLGNNSKSNANINNMTSSSSSSGSATKVPYTKTSSSSSSTSGMNLSKSTSKPSSSSPKSSSNTDITKLMRERERERDKSRIKSSGSEKSVFSNKERHSSPGGTRDEIDGERSFKAQSKDANFLVEGLMKPLDTSKFQIPKLKNQTTPDKSAPGSQFNDFSARSLEHGKYPFPHTPNARNSPDLIAKSNYPLNVSKPLMNMGSSSPKTNMNLQTKDQDRPIEFTTKSQDIKMELPQRLQGGAKDESGAARTERSPDRASYPLVNTDAYKQGDPGKAFSVPKMGSEERKGADSSMKPPTSGSVARSGATTPQEAAEMLLDFSSSSGSKVSGVVAVRPVYPAPPAMALHLVKSPAPSPLVVPSPHSNSPCITDDELMDEALVGPGK